MEKLYKELLDREKYLKSIEQTKQVKARLSELFLMTVRVQQLLLPIVSSSLLIEDFHIGFEYLQYEMDSERYLNKGMIWKKKKYGFDSPRLHKIKELIDNGEIARCNES
tara:strand:- start:524 stop:850 length:327 start_codon:yes stop_codon:yes gene_type:complete